MTDVLTHDVQPVVFMNKCDILKKKLEAGIKVNKHMTSYGTRENSADAFAKCSCLLLQFVLQANEIQLNLLL